jgi:hypothetical protein
MNQTDYLHDKGTDRLIADVRAFDPTRVNVGEQDEVPEMFDEMTGPCETRPVGPAKSKFDLLDLAKEHGERTYHIGYRAGILDCINAVLTSHLSAADRFRLVDAFAALKLPSDTTRNG